MWYKINVFLKCPFSCDFKILVDRSTPKHGGGGEGLMFGIASN